MNHLKHQLSLDAFEELTRRGTQRLEEVWQRVEDGCRERIALKFTTGVLTFAADADDDTAEAACQDVETFDPAGMDRADGLAPWASLIGRLFGWGWAAINQQGYPDGVLLSFDGLQPWVLLVAAASSLRVYAVQEADAKPTNGAASASSPARV